MKKLFPLALMLCASAAMAQVTSLSSLNDQSGVVPSVKIRNVPLGSGIPNALVQNDTFGTATSLGNGVYQVPGYLPYYPTAATIWPRVVQVRCNAGGECDGYSITPALGRGEYLYVQPVMVPTVQVPAAKAEDFTLSADALFDFDKATLKSGATAQLDDLVSKLKARQGSHVTVIGYTDQIGSDQYNQRLSQRRADTVGSYLASKGVPNQAQGYGERDPLVKNCPGGKSKAAIACMAPNRRVEVQVAAVN